jgi:hypothetical protein
MFMRMVHFICLLALLAGASLYRPDRANAQGTPDQQQACAPDAMRLCSDAMPDVAKITACMSAKHALLSQACKTAMLAGSRHAPPHRATRVVRRERCDPFTHLCN